MPRPTLVDALLSSAAELRALERWVPLERTLSQALAAIVSDVQGRQVLAAVMEVPLGVRSHTPAWHMLTLWACCVNRRSAEMLDFVQRAVPAGTVLAPEARAYVAWALVREGQAGRAHAELDAAWAGLTGEALGFAWRVRAQALVATGDPGWTEAFETAAQHLSGRRRSLCLAEYGHALDEAGRGIQAREAWRAALPGFAQDVFHHAWLRFNLGVSAFRDGAPEAEVHLMELARLARSGAARPFASRAWTGIGTFRRSQGEWSRAEDAYQRALRLAGPDRDDELQARRGLGHVRRLRGLPELSLEDFGQAVSLAGDEPHWIHVDVASVWAQLGHAERAQQELAQAGPLEGVNAARAALVGAELRRLQGDEAGALQVLGGLDLRAYWAREERGPFPALFALAARHGATVPPAPDRGRTQVAVFAAGVLRVQVNQRTVPLPPTGRSAELLVALLEEGRTASVEKLVDLLYPDAPPQARGPRKQLSALAADLRQALGWGGSVVSQRGAYTLDPDAEWHYDVRDLRQAGHPVPGFLEGIYSTWVQTRHQQLVDAI